jgi:thiol-disulfide isomerase/thioredoxin
MAIRSFSAFLLFFLAVTVPAGAESDASGPLVVKIHADWCGTCVKLNSTWEELQAQYGQSARFVVLDVTDKAGTVAASVEADRLGISEFFDANKGKTGTIAILDPETGEVYELFKGEFDPKAYDGPLAGALKSS